MMSSLHIDRGWLVIAFRLTVGGKLVLVRLYPGLRATRDGRRHPFVKEIRELIQMRRWSELAEKFPRCKQLQAFRALEPDRSTFREVSERFLEYQATVNKPATVQFYRDILKVHIWAAEKFSRQPLKLIGASDIAAVYAPIHVGGAQAQAANVRRVLSAVFNWARSERGTDGEYLVNDNPVTRTKHLGVERKGDEIDPFTAEEVRAILSTANGWQRRLVTVAFGAGLEPGENFGLKVADINLPNRKIQIRQRFTRFGVGAVKNVYRRREVDMTEAVYRVLREQVAAIELRSPWLWARHRNQPHNPQNFSRRAWKSLLQGAGVKHREFYQCRHTFATQLLSEGKEWRYIADQMGHGSLKMLMEHYWKWRPGSIKSVRESI
ncbi:MAG: site-specific integrase [Deltaproteobacteria bacterium]|nr:site-specific integrase [Deltaproteobacteria bacterium]